jgi:hypothetical protein
MSISCCIVTEGKALKHRVTALIILVLLFGISRAGHAQSSRALPDDNLAYPVLITLKSGGTGSGFYLNTPAAIYLVTAKHVLFDPTTQKLRDTQFEVLSYSGDLSDPKPNLISVDLAVLGKENIKLHLSQDVIVVKMFADSANRANWGEVLPGITVKQNAAKGIIGVGLDTIKTFDQVLIGNEVVVLGYPTSLGLQAMPQIDSHRPLLRKGLVAGQNYQKRSIVLDCPSYPGNSGGPVIEIDPEGFKKHFMVIGVLGEYVPYADGGKTFFVMTNSGYSIATPMDFVLELIK